MNIGPKLGIGGKASHLRIVDPKTSKWYNPKGYENDTGPHNRILDCGLDMPATHFWEDCFSVASCGSDGAETIDTQTTLNSYLYHSTTYVTSTELNGYEATGTTGSYQIHLWRTYTVFTNSTGSDVTVRELGLSPNDSTDAELFARIKLDTDVVVPDGLSLQFTYKFTIDMPNYTYNPIAKDFYLGGATRSGVEFLDSYTTDSNGQNGSLTFLDNGTVQRISSTGDSSTNQGHLLEPSNENIGTGSYDLGAAIDQQNEPLGDSTVTSGGYLSSSASKGIYVNGSYSQSFTFEFDENKHPSETLYSICIGAIFNGLIRNDNYNSFYWIMWRWYYSSGITKPVGAIWTVTWTISWGRS